MNVITIFLALFLSVVSAKISITYPENNETAKQALENLMSKFKINDIRSCGKYLSGKSPNSQATYVSCIKSLNNPKIFEKHLLELKNEDFAANGGIAFSGTISDVIAKVSKELETICSHIDPNTFDKPFHDKIINENRNSNSFSSIFINSNQNTSSSSNESSFELDTLHMILILIILVLAFGGTIFYLNDRRSVNINRKLINDFDLSEKI